MEVRCGSRLRAIPGPFSSGEVNAKLLYGGAAVNGGVARASLELQIVDCC